MNKEKEDDIIVVTKPTIIEEGKHKGKITNVIRNLPNLDEGRKYDYLDIEIQVIDIEKKPTLRTGFPTTISELSSLGRLLIKAGMEFSEDDKITISTIKDTLVDRNVTFLSANQKTESGEFARILRDTIDFEK